MVIIECFLIQQCFNDTIWGHLMTIIHEIPPKAMQIYRPWSSSKIQ